MTAYTNKGLTCISAPKTLLVENETQEMALTWHMRKLPGQSTDRSALNALSLAESINRARPKTNKWAHACKCKDDREDRTCMFPPLVSGHGHAHMTSVNDSISQTVPFEHICLLEDPSPLPNSQCKHHSSMPPWIGRQCVTPAEKQDLIRGNGFLGLRGR